MSDPHSLLPWYFNGTLEPEESRRFEEHLPGCDGCRRELELLEGLSGDLEAHGADLFGDHPDPGELLSAADPQQADLHLEAGRAEQVLRHAALCAACAEELGWLTGATRALPARGMGDIGGLDAAADSGPGARATGRDGAAAIAPVAVGDDGAGSSRLRWSAWLGWAVAAAAVVLLLIQPRGADPDLEQSATGIVTPRVIRSTERATDAQVVSAPAAAPAHLLFEVDLGAGSFPVSFEVSGPDGETIFRAAGLQASGLVGGAAIAFVCERSECPDGAYRARVVPAGRSEPELTYTFRLATGAEAR